MYTLLAMSLALCPETIDEQVQQLLEEKMGDKLNSLNQQLVLRIQHREIYLIFCVLVTKQRSMNVFLSRVLNS